VSKLKGFLGQAIDTTIYLTFEPFPTEQLTNFSLFFLLDLEKLVPNSKAVPREFEPLTTKNSVFLDFTKIGWLCEPKLPDYGSHTSQKGPSHC